MKTVGERLFEILEYKNISLYEFSKLSKIPYNTLKRYKTGCQPTHDTMQKISKALGIPVIYFYGVAEPQEENSLCEKDVVFLNFLHEIDCSYHDDVIAHLRLEASLHPANRAKGQSP